MKCFQKSFLVTRYFLLCLYSDVIIPTIVIGFKFIIFTTMHYGKLIFLLPRNENGLFCFNSTITHKDDRSSVNEARIC